MMDSDVVVPYDVAGIFVEEMEDGEATGPDISSITESIYSFDDNYSSGCEYGIKEVFEIND